MQRNGPIFQSGEFRFLSGQREIFLVIFHPAAHNPSPQIVCTSNARGSRRTRAHARIRARERSAAFARYNDAAHVVVARTRACP